MCVHRFATKRCGEEGVGLFWMRKTSGFTLRRNKKPPQGMPAAAAAFEPETRSMVPSPEELSNQLQKAAKSQLQGKLFDVESKVGLEKERKEDAALFGCARARRSRACHLLADF